MKDVQADLNPALHDRLRDRFDPDLRRLGSWLGIDLNCANFAAMTDPAARVDRGDPGGIACASAS